MSKKRGAELAKLEDIAIGEVFRPLDAYGLPVDFAMTVTGRGLDYVDVVIHLRRGGKNTRRLTSRPDVIVERVEPGK